MPSSQQSPAQSPDRATPSVVVLPLRLGYVMVGEDLSVIGCEKSTAKNINVCLWSGPCKAHQAVVELVVAGSLLLVSAA
jgi:hypothetical protein